MNKKNATNTRLELDTELIADLETEGTDIKGGQSGSGGGTNSGGISVTVQGTRRGAVAGDDAQRGC